MLEDVFKGNNAVAIVVMVGLQALRQSLLIWWPWLIAPARPSAADATRSPITSGQVIAGALAYGYYVAAALMAGAQFPGFLQGHLFDGFAPAVLVAFLIYRFGREDAKPGADNYPWKSFLLLYLQSAVVFAVIAAAAVFSAGKTDFVPVIWAAVIGGMTFPAGTVGAARRAARDRPAEVERGRGPTRPSNLRSRYGLQPPATPGTLPGVPTGDIRVSRGGSLLSPDQTRRPTPETEKPPATPS